jgi:aminoglycoside 2''-phosphotransferase
LQMESPMETKHYLKRIRDAFPDLKWMRHRKVHDGIGHTVIILDNEIVFRFEDGVDEGNLLRERTILRAIKSKVNSLPIPDYTFIPKLPNFAGYKAIQGTRLSPWRFARLSKSSRVNAAKKIGTFLGELHAIPVSEMKDLGVSSENDWKSAKGRGARAEKTFRKNGHTLKPKIQKLFKKWIEESHKKQYEWTPVFAHCDFWDKHIYHNPGSGQLTGIIDWEDITIMDPAKDFSGLWVYGETFVDTVLTHYPYTDATLKGRSFEHYWPIVVGVSCSENTHWWEPWKHTLPQ